MKVAILGFGVEGQDAARYFLKKKVEVSVFDKRGKKELVDGKWKKEHMEWVTGPKYLAQGFWGFDLIVRSPGFYRYHPALAAAEKEGAVITSTTKLFFELCPTPIIGVTGTKGKGTTARMLEQALREAGFKVVLGGNIGEPTLALLTQTKRSDWVILELSSFQTIDLNISPRMAVVTNISVDHLDWHKNEEEYVRAKENLWRHQTGEDFAVFNWDDPKSRELSRAAVGQVFYFSAREEVEVGAYAQENKVFIKMAEPREIGDTKLGVPGEHNLSNALGALTAAVLAGADEEEAWAGIKGFSGAEHRLEEVGREKGVLFVNDSAATTPEATMAAIRAYAEPKILILGGSKKGREFDELAKAVLEENVKAVILIGETAPDIKRALEEAGYTGQTLQVQGDMKKIVKEAKKKASAGDVVLLSPACASFGLFKNYKDRGEKFKEAVR